MDNRIHPSAIISSKAQLGTGNEIGPFVVLEDDVILGDHNKLFAGAVIKNGCRIGNQNTFHEYSVIGGAAQDLSIKEGDASFVTMGNENVVREFVTIHRSNKPKMTTTLGDKNYLMANSHVAHDCQLQNQIVIAPATGLGGHVHVGDRAFISGGVMVHQFVQIGTYGMVGGNTKLTQDAPPYMITDGHPGTVRGVNSVGLRRGGFSSEHIKTLKKAYQMMFSGNRPMSDVVADLRELNSSLVDVLLNFLESSKRGIPR